jgi:tetratricopeptide (TPR) repeat protein
VVQARAVLNDQLSRSPLVKDVVFLVDPTQVRMINYTDPASGNGQSVVLSDVLPASITVSFSPSPNAYTEAAWKVTYDNFQDGHQYFWVWSGWSQSDAQQIADALRVLVLDSRQNLDGIFAAKYQKFLETCQAWLEGKGTAPFPEEARQHQLLAQDAMSRNDSDKALDEYDKALNAAPCWGQGRYQAAQLEAQEGYYPIAIQDMKKYLLLTPNAPNAQAVRDQITIWNGRMGIE